MASSKLQKEAQLVQGNKWIVEQWEKELQGWEMEELLDEVILYWKEQGLNGYKQI